MIKILEENDFFIVLDKPAGVSIHNESPSLVEYLTKLRKPLHFVNRIDQETSGLVVVAQKPIYHDGLAAAFETGTKQYRALLRSPWKRSEKKMTWSWPLTDVAEGRKNPQGVSAKRVECQTEMEVVRSNQYFTEITATLMTGRQHQIRKHAALAKHPIVGDKRYNEPKYNEQIAGFYKAARMHLHAEKLEFTFGQEDYKFTSRYNLDIFFKEVPPAPKQAPTT